MEDILDLYKRPYNPDEPLICMNEASKQLTQEARLPIPVKPGQPARFDFEYRRNGVCSIFMFYDPFGGNRFVSVTERRTKKDWAWQIKELLEKWYPDARKVILVMDNLNTHVGASLYETFPPAEARALLNRLEIHYTPKHGSWLNIAEIELRILNGQCLNRRIPDKDSLAREVSQWQRDRNIKNPKVDWHFTSENARIKLKRLYPTILS